MALKEFEVVLPFVIKNFLFLLLFLFEIMILLQCFTSCMGLDLKSAHRQKSYIGKVIFKNTHCTLFGILYCFSVSPTKPVIFLQY